MEITLTNQDIKNLLENKELLKNKVALILLSTTNYVEPSTLFTVYIGLTKNWLDLISEGQEKEMEGITIKLDNK